MRKLFLTIAFLFYSSLLILAQDQKVNLIRQTNHLKDGRIQLVEMNKEGDTVIVGYLSSVNPDIRNGEFRFYGNNRTLQAKGNYSEDIPAGLWQYFDKEGNVTKTLNYNKTIEFLTADTIKPKEVILVAEQMPYYKIQSTTSYETLEYFKKYILENMVYPIYAEKKNITGRIFIQFVVNETGKVCNLSVIRSSGSLDLNMEAFRLMSESPLWEPGKRKNVAVAVSLTIPISFNLK